MRVPRSNFINYKAIRRDIRERKEKEKNNPNTKLVLPSYNVPIVPIK